MSIYLWSEELDPKTIGWDNIDAIYVWKDKVWEAVEPMQIEVLYSSSNWRIEHWYNSSEWYIKLYAAWSYSPTLSWEPIYSEFTISDRNLWASTYYDMYSSPPMYAYQWNVYEWWNNYPFNAQPEMLITSSTPVNTTWYWPWNYYYDNVYTIWNSDARWDIPNNDNLWWDTTDTELARRWPCQEWWHIPSRVDIYSLCDMLGYIILKSIWSMSTTDYQSYLLIWPNYILDNNWTTSTEAGSNSWSIRLSTPWWILYWYQYYSWPWSINTNIKWTPIRPFKNWNILAS